MQNIQQEFEQVADLTSELSDSLGDTVDTEFEDGTIVERVAIVLEKGTLDAGSYDNPEQVADLLENVNMDVAGSDLYDVRGEIVKTYQHKAYRDESQIEYSPSGAGRRGVLILEFVDPVPVSNVSKMELTLDFANVSDISGGSTAADTQARVLADYAPGGTQFTEYRKLQRQVEPVEQGSDRTFSLNPSGDVYAILINEDTADLGEFKAEAVRTGQENVTLVGPADTTDIRDRTLRGTEPVTLPSGIFFVPIPSGKIDPTAIDNVKVTTDVDTAGDVEIFAVQGFSLDN